MADLLNTLCLAKAHRYFEKTRAFGKYSVGLGKTGDITFEIG